MTKSRDRRSSPPAAAPSPATSPPIWMPAIAGALSLVVWVSWFSPPTYDSDFWWHLRTGQYIVEHRVLPVSDPFSFTTAGAPLTYPGETVTRRFNLTHEWLSQTLLYLVYRAGGFG